VVGVRNLLCWLPDGCLGVTVHAPHPCGGYYLLDARCYGPDGYIGMWLDGAPPSAEAFRPAGLSLSRRSVLDPEVDRGAP
jgi:hypothetical protein